MTAAGRVGYAISRVDHDEWSWSVEVLREGETIWGSGSDATACGCAYSKAEAVSAIRAELQKLGVEEAKAVRLPF